MSAPCTGPGTNATIARQAKLIRSQLKKHLKQTSSKLQTNCPAPVENQPNLLFSKALPHDEFGNVDEKQLQRLLEACRTGDMSQMNRVRLGGTLKLHSPSTVSTCELFGVCKPEIILGAPPRVTSPEAGAEMVDLYWRALIRDIPYADWVARDKVNKHIRQAIRDLRACGNAYQGPKPVTVANLFRGPGEGVDKGPLVSQFALLPFQLGNMTIEQKRQPIAPGVDYMTSVPTYLAAQNGNVMEQTHPTDLPPRYIITPRDGAAAVHSDVPVQWAQNAVQILTALGCPFNPLNPFVAVPQRPSSALVKAEPRITNEFPFLDCGVIDCMDLVGCAIRLVLNMVFWNKWHYFRLRPENTGYLVHLNKTGQRKVLKGCPKLSPTILDSSVLPRVFKKFGTYLLPLAFPEGCPPHPSFSCAHCTLAAASVTIVKAFFDGSFTMDAMAPSADGQALVALQPPQKVTVADELNKLVNNIAFWRDNNGFHYLSDELHGIPMGEAVADNLLRDCVKRYQFAAGFQYRSHAGKLVTIVNFPETPLNGLVKSSKRSVHKQKQVTVTRI